MANVQNFTKSNFKTTIQKGVTLVDFFAVWCGPCRMMVPILDQLSETFQGKINIGKLDIDAEFDIANEYKVTSVPTLIIFKDGQEKNRIVGLRDAQTIKDLIQSVLK